MRPPLRKILLDLGLLAVLVALIIVISLAYVGREQFFYAWDFRGYQQTAINQVHNLFASPGSMLRAAYDSLGDDYNALYTLPLAPLMAWIGRPESRPTYILSLALVYTLAYTLLIGAIFASLVRQRQHAAFWTGAFAGVLLPMAWIPTLRGYPDAGGAAAIALAILIYVKDPQLRRIWRAIVIGFALALAILFRRHFGYAAIAFLLAMGVMAVLRCMAHYREDRRAAWHGLGSDSLRIILIGVSFALNLLLFGYPFVKHVLAQNLLQLYSSFETSLLNILRYYRAYYGWLALLLACTGLGLGVYKRLLKSEATCFICLLALINFTVWSLIVRQVNPHYTLHFTFFILLGITACAWLVFFGLKGVWRFAGLAALAILLLANSLVWFGVSRLAAQPLAQVFFPQDIQPLRRADYAEIARLVKYLRSKTDPDQAIYVVDSSALINADLLASADLALYPNNRRLNIIQSPQVDSRDQYPLQALLQADLVVLSNPLQRHLPLAEQGVVASIYDLFADQAEITHDFTRLSGEFKLIDGITTRVYKRKQATPMDVALRTFQQIATTVGAPPGSQPDWLALDPVAGSEIDSLESSYRLHGAITSNQPTQTYLFRGSLPDSGVLQGNLTLAPNCPQVRIDLWLANGKGETARLAEKSFPPGTTSTVSVDFSTTGWPYLLLELTTAGAMPPGVICQTNLDMQIAP